MDAITINIQEYKKIFALVEAIVSQNTLIDDHKLLAIRNQLIAIINNRENLVALYENLPLQKVAYAKLLDLTKHQPFNSKREGFLFFETIAKNKEMPLFSGYVVNIDELVKVCNKQNKFFNPWTNTPLHPFDIEYIRQIDVNKKVTVKMSYSVEQAYLILSQCNILNQENVNKLLHFKGAWAKLLPAMQYVAMANLLTQNNLHNLIYSANEFTADIGQAIAILSCAFLLTQENFDLIIATRAEFAVIEILLQIKKIMDISQGIKQAQIKHDALHIINMDARNKLITHSSYLDDLARLLETIVSNNHYLQNIVKKPAIIIILVDRIQYAKKIKYYLRTQISQILDSENPILSAITLTSYDNINELSRAILQKYSAYRYQIFTVKNSAAKHLLSLLSSNEISALNKIAAIKFYITDKNNSPTILANIITMLAKNNDLLQKVLQEEINPVFLFAPFCMT